MIRTTAKWPFSPVSDVAKIHLGGTPKRAIPEYWGGDIKWASAADIASCNSCYIRRTTENITPLGVQRSAAKVLGKNTIVITARGTVGAVCLLPEPMSFNQSCYGLVCNAETDPNYFYYALKARIRQIKAQTYGAVFDTITIQSFDNITVPTPQIDTQRKIAAILSAYDNLIENNIRRIRILEEMAQMIYREWFINFRFPGHETIRMVDSKLGKIPEGWDILNLFDIAEVAYGFPFKSKFFSSKKSGLPVVRIRDINQGYSSTYTPEEVAPKYIVNNGDILVGMDGNFGMCKWTGGAALLNQRVVRFRPKTAFGRYHLFLALEAPIHFFDSTVVGTTVAHLSDEDLRSIELSLPNSKCAKERYDVFEPLLDLEINLCVQDTLLRKTRDLLLPRLISGELDVSDLDIAINDSGGS